MNTPTCFSLNWNDQVLHLVLNRPEAMNTMHPTFWRELDTLLTEVQHEGRARALVISSTGKHFTAGMSLDTFSNAITMDEHSAEGRAAIYDLLTDMQATFTKLETLRIPVICAIQGGCIGGGVDMVSAACIRYASADAFFCIQEINIGMVADVGTLQRLPKLVGEGLAREMAFTGRRVSGTEAQGMRLVNRCFASDAALAEGVDEVARTLAAKSPLALRGTKHMLNHARDHRVAEGLDHVATWNAAMLYSQDLREAVAAAREKRAPVFRD